MRTSAPVRPAKKPVTKKTTKPKSKLDLSKADPKTREMLETLSRLKRVFS